MTNRERNRAFRKERARQLKRLTAAHRAAARDVGRLLEEARRRISAELGAAGLSEYQAWQLPNLQQSVAQAMAEIGDALALAGGEGAAAAHAIGADLVDKSLAAAGVRIAGLMPDVDLRQLMAIRTFMTGRLKDVAAGVGRRVNTQIGLTMIGAQGTEAAVTSVAGLIKSGRGRAMTIVRTEMGRAFSVATQERQALASEHLPGLKKQWRRSGKIHSRIAHDLADGQIVNVDEPFKVGGVRLMYPRDPEGPAKETINCGCVSLPHMEKWDVRQPDRQPFSDEEVFRNPLKRDLAREFNPTVRHANIETLERLSRPAARRQIAEDLTGADFAAFVARTGGAAEQRPVAMVPERLAKAMGAEAGVVRLSSYTVVKQRERRRGQHFTAADYRRVQGLLDGGLVLEESPGKLVVFGRGERHEVWRAVVKATEDRSEIYLQTLHRSNDAQRKNTAAKLKIIREEE